MHEIEHENKIDVREANGDKNGDETGGQSGDEARTRRRRKGTEKGWLFSRPSFALPDRGPPLCSDCLPQSVAHGIRLLF